MFGLFQKTPEKIIKKHAPRVRNKRAQAPDRYHSIQTIGELKSQAGVRVLLERFLFRCDPSITDQEEKELAFKAILSAGSEAVGPTVDFLHQQEEVAWAVKILREIATDETVVEELLNELDSMTTEYQRDPQKKIQTLAVLNEFHEPRIVESAKDFLDDPNDGVRFAAVDAIAAQPASGTIDFDSLIEAYKKEDSVRVKCRILEGFAERLIPFPDGVSLVDGFRRQSDGLIKPLS